MWLLNSPLATRRAIAIAIMAVAILVLALLAASASANLMQVHRGIDEKRQMLGRLEAITAQLPRAMEAATPETPLDDGFLRGDSDAVIRASMQQQFQSIAGAQRVTVMSVGKAPDFVKNDVTYAGLQANVSGTVESMHRMLLALEVAQPMLFVTHLTVRSPDALGNRPPAAEPVLIAQLRVYGALRPDLVETSGDTQ